MAALFVRRMHAVEQVADYKRAHGLPVFDGAREDAVVAKNSAYVEDEDIRPYYVEFLRDTMKSHERCSVVEVMGRHAGHLAMAVGISCGATVVVTPEKETDFEIDVI